MDADLDTLATALYVTTDDLLRPTPSVAPWRPRGGITPQLERRRAAHPGGDAGPARLHQRARWLRYAARHLRAMFPYLPHTARLQQAAAQAGRHDGLADRAAGRATPASSTDDVWVVDSTPVECGRSRETVKRSDLAGWAEYGYCASHSRFFWGLRLHLVVHPARPARRLGPDRRQGRRTRGPDRHPRPPPRPGRERARADPDRRQELLRPRVRGRLAEPGSTCSARPARARQPRPGERFFKPLRQIIESVNDTLKGQLDLEHHGGRTIAGVCARDRSTHPRPDRRDLAQRPASANRSAAP